MTSALLRGRTLDPYAVAMARTSISRRIETLVRRQDHGTLTRKEHRELRRISFKDATPWIGK